MKIKEALERLKEISRGETFSLDAVFWFMDHTPEKGIYPAFRLNVWGKTGAIVFCEERKNLSELIELADREMGRHYSPEIATDTDEAAAQVDEAAAEDIDLADAPATEAIPAEEFAYLKGEDREERRVEAEAWRKEHGEDF